MTNHETAEFPVTDVGGQKDNTPSFFESLADDLLSLQVAEYSACFLARQLGQAKKIRHVFAVIHEHSAIQLPYAKIVDGLVQGNGQIRGKTFTITCREKVNNERN